MSRDQNHSLATWVYGRKIWKDTNYAAIWCDHVDQESFIVFFQSASPKQIVLKSHATFLISKVPLLWKGSTDKNVLQETEVRSQDGSTGFITRH